MKKKRFSVEQIVATLKQIELGMSVAEASRQLGVSDQAIYRWKKVYGGLQSDPVRELKLLQEENARLKKLVAELSLDKAILHDINSKRARPAVKRQAVDYVVDRYATSRRRACRVVCQSIAASSTTGHARAKDSLTTADAGAGASAHPLRLPASARAAEARGLVTGQEPDVPTLHWGKLQLRSKRPRRRKLAVARRERYVPKRPNQAWSMDFVADHLVNGTRFRALTIVDV